MDLKIQGSTANQLPPKAKTPVANILNVICVVFAAVAAGMSAYVALLQYKSGLEDRRAWIGTEHQQTINLEPNKPITVNILFRNSGRTPATNVQGWILGAQSYRKYGQGDESYAIDSEQLRDYAIKGGPHTIKSLGPAAPGAPLIIRSNDMNVLTPAGLDKMRNDDLRIYTFGEITYESGAGTKGVTDFCQYTSFTPMTSVLESTTCLTGNDMK